MITTHPFLGAMVDRLMAGVFVTDSSLKFGGGAATIPGHRQRDGDPGI
ncbi:MAG: hypothetical protein ABID84_05470 [Chloroflexota bacterium]